MTSVCQFHLKSVCGAPPVCRGGHVRGSQMCPLTLGSVLSCETWRTCAKPPSSKCLYYLHTSSMKGMQVAVANPRREPWAGIAGFA